jgi:hypothetical protein
MNKVEVFQSESADYDLDIEKIGAAGSSAERCDLAVTRELTAGKV